MKRVTALRPERRDRVRVELDGEPWRTLPAGAVVGAGLMVGTLLDRERARALARSLRRARALSAATGALARRERSAAGLDAYLGERGVRAPERAEAVDSLARYGYVDDTRFANERAASLARRGFGDEAIRFDLEQQLVGAEEIERALGRLDPEHSRAEALVRPGEPVAKTARRLASKGFATDTIESVLRIPDL